MMDSTNIDIKAIKEYMLDNFSGLLDKKRFDKLESAIVSKNNSKKYNSNPGMDWTEACVAVLMALEDPVKYNLDNMLDRFDALGEPAKSHSVAFADHVKMVGETLIGAGLITANNLQPVSAVLVTGSLASFTGRTNKWLGDDSITTTRIMTSTELVNTLSFQIAVETAQGIGKYDYTEFHVYNQKLEALAEIGIKHGHDISGLAAVISPESILNLYNKHYKELDKVLPLITDKNRFEVASYLHANGEKKAFDKLIPAELTPNDKKYINELTDLLYDLNKHAESLFKEADSSSILPAHTKVIDAYSETNELVKPVINQIERGKMNYELFSSLQKVGKTFKGLKEKYRGNEAVSFDEPKSFFARAISALIAMFKTKVTNEKMSNKIDAILDNFNSTPLVTQEVSGQEPTEIAVEQTAASTEVATTPEVEEWPVKGKHTAKHKEDKEEAKKNDPNIVYI